MIVLPSIDEQKKCPQLLSACTKANFAETCFERNFAIRKHCRIVIEIESTYLFNVGSLTRSVFADFTIFVFVVD